MEDYNFFLGRKYFTSNDGTHKTFASWPRNLITH